MLTHSTCHQLCFMVLAASLAAGCTTAATKPEPTPDAAPAVTPGETRNVLGRGTIAAFNFIRRDTANLWEVSGAATKAASDVVMSQIDLAPGQCVPWHIHNGAIIVILAAGTGTNYLPTDDGGCKVETVVAGTALIDDGLDVHSMCNKGPEDKVTLFVTYIVPKGAATNFPLVNPGTCPGGAP
jgi:quercetin dioxygenase-like cupin family protein